MIPNLFSKLPVPKTLPKELNEFILKNKNLSKEKFLKRAFMYTVKKGRGSRLNLIFKFFKLFKNDVNDIVNNKGYMHCTTMNYLLRIILIKSGLFTEKDITPTLTTISFIFPHQYLKVRVSKHKVISVDAWGYQFGINLGSYAHFRLRGSMNPIR